MVVVVLRLREKNMDRVALVIGLIDSTGKWVVSISMTAGEKT